MINFLKSPLFRISFSMMMLVISLLLASDFLGLFPKHDNNALTERKFIAETLAVHVAMELEQEDAEKISELLRTTVTRNSLVDSVAVRRADGTFIDSYGNHQQYWNLESSDKSTPTHVQVPLYEGENQIATVEIRYQGLNAGRSLLDRRASFASVILFVAISGFAVFCVFLKKTLRELDPDAVIPERVRKALDTLAEGLLIINRDGEIVFSNAAFARTIGIDASELAGKNCSSLEWELNGTDTLPWQPLLNGGELATGASIKLNTGYHQVSTFTVNATPIVARADEIRGALITFNDITEVEIKNAELRNALVKLEKSKLEITRQNEELEYLATRDPLTGSLNRRSFFSGFETIFEQANLNKNELACFMTDIDHFKSVNDTHGHGVGDEVIKYLANVLADHARPNDLVGRFGGEEFCVVMPATTVDAAMKIAEQIRETIEKGEDANFTDKCKITASFGVATIKSGSRKPNDLVEQADKALYYSKENGRNRVTRYNRSFEDAPSEQQVINTNTAAQEAPKAPESKTVPILATRNNNAGSGVKAPDKASVDALLAKAMAKGNKGSVPVLSVREVPAVTPIVNEDNPEYGTLRLDRTLLIDRIEQALNIATKNTHHVGILLISIDALQRINDTLGFSVNEKLYRQINARLHNTLQNPEIARLLGSEEQNFSITRYGDTEICLTLHNIRQVMDFNEIQDRILDSFDQTITVDGHEVYVALDTGISVFPNHGTDADGLIRSASIAMRKARDTDGQNSFVYFSPEMNDESRKLIRLETELHQALSRNELFVAYQPKVDLRSGEIVAMEALVRWRHPEFGIVSPGDFIPVAEKTGLINEISAWITRVVCAQISMWHQAGHNDISVAINISPIELRNANFADTILNAIREFDIPPKNLEVEITESLVMEDMNQATKTLERLDRHGVEISIDDFGTGFASLSYLKLFPISKVKIDRSFVSDFAVNPADARIVSGVIAMSHSLGVKVVCEGVEEEAQLRFLQDHHCDQVQGNLLSLPLKRQDATKLLSDPRKVQKIIRDYNVNELGLSATTGAGTQTVITGVLNLFPDDERDKVAI
jgi:diguanylate cyclase (GGDEF)-like protein/PAS domain S-box-containing protein